MAELLVHKDVLTNYYKLPRQVQKRIPDLIERIKADPTNPSVRLHPLKGQMADTKVRGAEMPLGYRAIVIAPEKGDTFLLVHVDVHDKAYEWAHDKTFQVHEKTGSFQVFDVREVERATEERKHCEKQPDYPIQHLSDDDLYAAGVPRVLLPLVRSIDSDEKLEGVAEYLPQDCRNVLYGIAAGMVLEDAIEEMLGLTAQDREELAGIDTDDFSNVQERTANFDLFFIEGEEHLKDILSKSLEEWRVFLHPNQRKLVEWKTKGPMCVTGAAGTGKTVVLMHRAVHLARQLENRRHRVLITTFTVNLCVNIKQLLRDLDPFVFDRIEVTDLNNLARSLCRRSEWTGRLAGEEESEGIWKEVWKTESTEALPFSLDEIKTEYAEVIEPNAIDNEDDYLTFVRSGRPRLTRDQRREVWKVILAFTRALKKRDLQTPEGMIHQARLAFEKDMRSNYRHVLVDEVQDFSLEALRLVRSLSPVEEGLSDPLCVVGDGHQRVHARKVPLSRAGIPVVGRSRRLKVNYRTSQQIRKYAQALLDGVDVDDLDGNSTTIKGDHSVFQGPEPEIRKCASAEEECRVVAEWVSRLKRERGIEDHEICVTPAREDMRNAFLKAGMKTYILKPREADPGAREKSIRFAEMRRIKGLEFRAVVLACGGEDSPLSDIQSLSVRDRCELYVAASRAREHLLVTVAE